MSGRRYVLEITTSVQIFDGENKEVGYYTATGALAVDIRGTQRNAIVDSKVLDFISQTADYAKKTLQAENEESKTPSRIC